MHRLDALTLEMMDHDAGNPHRIQHLIQVHRLAMLIGRMEGLPPDTQETLEAAAIVHDIGIRAARAKYGASPGHLQEMEGPPLAAPMLARLGFPEGMAQRVCWLVAHHHTEDGVDGPDHRILLEADLLVNLHAHHADRAAIQDAYERVFRTASGRSIFHRMYPPEAGG